KVGKVQHPNELLYATPFSFTDRSLHDPDHERHALLGAAWVVGSWPHVNHGHAASVVSTQKHGPQSVHISDIGGGELLRSGGPPPQNRRLEHLPRLVRVKPSCPQVAPQAVGGQEGILRGLRC